MMMTMMMMMMMMMTFLVILLQRTLQPHVTKADSRYHMVDVLLQLPIIAEYI